MVERVSNEPLRRAFLQSEFNASELALMMGYKRNKKTSGKDRTAVWEGVTGDGTKLNRKLGIKPQSSKGSNPIYTTTIEADEALKMARILGLDPVDVDC